MVVKRGPGGPPTFSGSERLDLISESFGFPREKPNASVRKHQPSATAASMRGYREHSRPRNRNEGNLRSVLIVTMYDFDAMSKLPPLFA